MAVDHLDLHQGEVLLPLNGQANRPLNDQAGAQAEAANLTGRDIDVLRRSQVVVGGAAQEAVAVGQHFQRAGTAHHLAALDLTAYHGHDELGAVHAGVFGDPLALGELEQLGHRQAIEVVEAEQGRTPRLGGRPTDDLGRCGGRGRTRRLAVGRCWAGPSALTPGCRRNAAGAGAAAAFQFHCSPWGLVDSSSLRATPMRFSLRY